MKKNKKNLYILLGILVLSLIILIITFNMARASETKILEEQGLPSLSIWGSFVDVVRQAGSAANNTDNPLIDSNREVPKSNFSITDLIRTHWISFSLLLLIAFVFIAIVMVLFKVYNG